MNVQLVLVYSVSQTVISIGSVITYNSSLFSIYRLFGSIIWNYLISEEKGKGKWCWVAHNRLRVNEILIVIITTCSCQPNIYPSVFKIDFDAFVFYSPALWRYAFVSPFSNGIPCIYFEACLRFVCDEFPKHHRYIRYILQFLLQTLLTF